MFPDPEEPQQDENPYRALVRQDQEQQQGAVAAGVGQSTPDARAQAITLADKYRLPHDVVERNLDAFKQRAREDVPLERQVLHNNPKLAQWLASSPAAAAAADDIPQLQKVDHALSFADSIRRSIDNQQASAGGFVEWLGELTGADSLRHYGFETRIANTKQAQAYGNGQTFGGIKGPWDLVQWAKQTVGDQIPVMGPMIASSAVGAKIGGGLFTLAGPEATPFGIVIGGLIGAAIPAFVSNVGETEGQVKQAVQPPGMIEPGTVDLYRQPSVPNADGSHSTVDSISIEENGREVLIPRVTPDGRHLTDQEAIAEYHRTGLHLGTFVNAAAADQYAAQLHEAYANGTLAELEGRHPGWVFLGGSAVAAFDTALPGHVGARLVETFGRETAEKILKNALLRPVKATFLRGVVGQGVTAMATEGVTEALQEAIQAETAAHATGTPMDWTQTGQAMLEAGTAGALLGGLTGASEGFAERRHINALVAAADQQQTFFTALGQHVTDSKLAQRLPAGMREFIAHATKDGPVETVYAPVDTFEQYWQSKNIAPSMMAAELTGRADALEEAKRTGADLAIPLAAYAEKIAPTEHNAFFAQELRLDPKLLNQREARELQATFEDVQRNAVREQRPLDEATAKGAAAVGARIVDQALAIGERPDVADQWGKLYEAVYGQIAQRYGRDPVQLFEARPLSIVRDDGAVFTPAAKGERIGVDIPASEATAGETPEQRDTRREAHLTALVSSYVRDARRLDPSVDPEMIRRELEQRLAMADEVRRAEGESGTGQELLRAIAANGGIRADQENTGEFTHYAVEGRDVKRKGDRGRHTWNGVAGVFDLESSSARSKTWDDMTRTLMQDPRFAYLGDDLNALIDAIDSALRAREASTDTFPGTEELQALGVVPGTKWWSDAWRSPDSESVTPNQGDAVDTGEGDVSFNPDEFAQRLRFPTPRRDQQLVDAVNREVVGYRDLEDRLTPGGTEHRRRLDAALEAHPPRALEQSHPRVRELEALATEKALGIEDVPLEQQDEVGQSTRFADDRFKDLNPVNCTDCAQVFLETSGAGGQIVGYAEEANQGLVAEGMGHDFAIVEDRFLVDPWAHQVEMVTERAVFDLEDPQDRAYVLAMYTDPAGWTTRVRNGEHGYDWIPYTAPALKNQTRRSDEELFQHETDPHRTHMTREDVAIATVQTLTPLAGAGQGNLYDPATREVPFPRITELAGMDLWDAAGGFDQAPYHVDAPVDRIVATQKGVVPSIVEEYIRALAAGEEQPPPLAIQYQGNYYLADGTHRATAMWALGQLTVPLQAIDVDEAKLQAVRGGAQPTDEAGRALLGEGGYVGARVEGNQAARVPEVVQPTTVGQPEGGINPYSEREARRQAAKGSIDTTPGGDEFYQLNPDTEPDGFEVIAPYLSDEQAARVRAPQARRILELFEELPADRDYEDAAIAARVKKGWYERSTKAIRAVFGPVDSVRFTALLASLSPQTSVQTNLMNALRMWTNWEAAGRPTAPKTLQRLLARSVAGGQEKSVLEAWEGNAVRALSTPDGFTIRLSGPKVQSFMRNLFGHLQEVTLDAWMTSFALVDARMLKGRERRYIVNDKAVTMRGQTAGYIAMSAKIRRVAETLTRKTGTTWTPAHVQETVWSWAKTLYELADAEGVSAVRLLKEGGLTDAAIAQTPDFAQLFTKDATVREMLEAAGYGEVLSALDKVVTADARRRDAAARREGAAAGQASQLVTPALLRAARRIDELRRQRGDATAARKAERLRDARRRVREARVAAAARKRARAGELYQELPKLPEREVVEQPTTKGRRRLETYTSDLFGKRFQGTYATSTKLEATGKRELGTHVILNDEDLATAVRYLGRGAVERFDAIVTDDAGVPLAIVGSFKGDVMSAPINIGVLLGEALRVKGAANIWLAHNHPSGATSLSPQDIALANGATRSFMDTGVHVRGVIAMTANGDYAFHDPVMDRTAAGTARPPSLLDTAVKVPIVERTLAEVGKLGTSITTPDQAQTIVPQLAGGKFGVVLLDARNQPIAFVPMSSEAAGLLRRGQRIGDLYKAVSVATPAGAILYAPDEGNAEEQAANAVNLANALSAGGVAVLDIVLEQKARGGRNVSMTALMNAAGQKFELSGEFGQEQPPSKIQGAFSPTANTIRLISGKADLSTFLHESGHFFLELLGDIATTVTADVAQQTPEEQQLLRDMTTVLRYGKFEGTLEEWRALPVDQRREVHEAFARAFEQYLSEGQAPSSELRQLFIKFRDWLVAAYRSARGLNIEIPEDVRGVFDRLLASDEAIADAQQEAQLQPLFTDPATAGVDQLTFDAYRRTMVEANQAAREELDRRLLQDWRRERQIWWKAERQVVEAAVRTEVTHDPTYVALAVMRTGKLPDGSMPAMGDGRPVKLSKTIIKREFGREVLEALQRKKPVVYSVEGGLHPDTAAELFGFASGQALLEAVMSAAPMERVIAGETDRRMRERHGDLLLEGMELKAIAEQVVYDQRAKVISEELRVLTQGMAGAVIPPADIIKAQAEAVIRRTPIRQLKPGLYLQAMRRASKQAFERFGKNDRRGAVQAKQQEQVAYAHWRAAREAKDRADVIRDRLNEFANKNTLRARIAKAGQDYLDQIDGFLERYEFTRVSQQQIDRRAALRAWAKDQEAEGLPIQIPDELLDDSRRVNWQELPLEELEGVNDTVVQIAHLARLKNRLLKARDARELETIRAEIAASVREHVKERRQTHEPRSADERRRAMFDGIFASHRKIAHLAREFDGFQDGGPMWEHVIRPLNEAADREATMNADATARLVELFNKHFTAMERSKFGQKQWIEALGKRDDALASLTKQGRLMVALYWGNETQRSRLMLGKGWNESQVQAILDTLDKRDWQFVQDVWHFVNGYWPEIAEKQRRVTGLAPRKEEATPVFTRFGEFTGGYFPLMYEGELSGDVYNLESAAAADMQKAAAYVHSTTARPHTKERAEGKVAKPLRLDFGTIWLHTSRVIHDLTHHEALIDVGRVIGGQGNPVMAAIYDTLGPRAYDQFRRALKDIAVGDSPAQQEAEGALGYLRSGVTVAGLGWSFTTMLLQPLGLTQSMARIGVKPVLRGVSHWLRGAVTMQHVVEGIYEKSEFMRNRSRTQLREVNEVRNQIGVDTGKWTSMADAYLKDLTGDRLTKQAVFDSFFSGIAKLQLVADIPTWLGAYEQHLANGEEEARAIALADQAVLDSQGGGQIKDLAAVQRGGPAWKVWTNFYSFFSTTYNLWTDSYRQTKVAKDPIAIGRLAVDYMLLFAIPAVLGRLLRDSLTGDLPDELEDPEQFAATLARELGAYMAGTMVGVREIAGALQGYQDYSGPAGARGFTTVSNLVTQATQMKADEAFFRTLNQAGGVLFHYPAGQVDRTYRGLRALANGDTQNPLAVLVGPPKKKR